MLLTHIRRLSIFRFIAFVLIFQFLTVQIPVAQAEVQYQEDSESYQTEKPADESEANTDSSDSESEVPNPNVSLQDNPLSAASDEPQEGGSGSTVFDSDVTFNGNAQLDSSQSQFGGASVRLDGQGDYLSALDSDDWDFGTGDFTIDFWVRFNAISGTVENTIYSHGISSIDDGTMNIYYFGDRLGFRVFNQARWIWTPSINTWYHVAITKASGTVRAFVDGSALSLADDDGVGAKSISNTSDVQIGQRVGGPGKFNGWIDEFRISKGSGRWTSNFTPPSQEYIPDPETVLLLHFNQEPPVPFSGSVTINEGPVTNQTNVTLTLQAEGGEIPGDYNGDSSVDAADYVVWRKMGSVQADYDTWRGNFGKTNGVTEMCLSNDNSVFTCQAYQTTINDWTLSEGDGSKTVYIKFRDYLGHESEVFSSAIVLDTTPPAGTMVINNDAPYTNSTSVTLTLTASDETSGVDQMQFSVDDGASWSDWEDFASAAQIDLSAGDGEKNVLFRLRDRAGLISELISDSIFLDVTPPIGDISINGGAEFALSATVNLFLYPIDLADDGVTGGSGVESARFSEDGGATWSNWQALATFDNMYTFSDTTNGPKEIQVQFRDFAGNESLVFSDTITLDTILPELYVEEGQMLKTNKRVRKVVILGPTQDQEGDELLYNYSSISQNLLDNALEFIILGNQLTYTPMDTFLGSGDITVQAYDAVSGEISEVTFNLEVRNPTLNYTNDPLSTYQMTRVDAIRAWNLSRGTDVTVAVIDTGVDLVHVDLDGNIFTNPGEIAGNGVDDDLNGKIDDIRGWDFYDNDNDPSPSNIQPGNQGAHGTHVAGIVAAENNGNGTVGIAPEAEILPIKVLNPMGSIEDLIAGINYAVDMGAKVINMSLTALISGPGGINNPALLQMLQNAIDAAYQVGVVVVAAAGNNDGADSNLYAPAGLNNVISVSSTNSSNARSSFSNTWADISAPGEFIRSTYWHFPYQANDYAFLSGTSMATPLVAGLVALLFAQNPAATPDNIWTRLALSAKSLVSSDPVADFGAGLIDAFKALTYDYWDLGGLIKTQWLEAPDEWGNIRYDCDEIGLCTGVAAGAGGFAGLGGSVVNAFVDFFSEPDSPSEAPLEHMPRLVASPIISPVGAAGLSVPASRASQFRAPLNWSALGLGLRVQSYGEAKDEHKDLKSDPPRFARSKKSNRR